jgi:hypothetical protein
VCGDGRNQQKMMPTYEYKEIAYPLNSFAILAGFLVGLLLGFHDEKKIRRIFQFTLDFFASFSSSRVPLPIDL